MIEQMLIKAATHNCVLTAVLPHWPNRAWFPLLLDLLIDQPVRLPRRHDIIAMPHNGRLHAQIHSLDLHVCRLSPNVRLIRAFRAQCQSESQLGNYVHQHRTSMSPSGPSSFFGVINGILILSRSL